MLRYKRKKKNVVNIDRKKITAQSISMALHIILIFFIFIFSPQLKMEIPTEKISVDFKYSSPHKRVVSKRKKKKSSKFKKRRKRRKRHYSSKKVIRTGKFLNISSKKKINLKKMVSISHRRVINRKLSNLLDVTEKLSKRSESKKIAEPLLNDLMIDSKKETGNDLIIGTRFNRKKIDISSKLEPLADKINGGKRVEKKDAEFEIGLIENSTYTIMPEFLWKTKLEYPLSARKRGSEGSVTLIINILKNGDVGMVRLAKSPLDPELANFVLKEAEKWKFKPMYKNGIPLSGEVSVKVKYTLKNKEIAKAVIHE